MSQDRKVTFKIQRLNPEKDRKPYFQEYSFTPPPSFTVLEGLYYILENLDHSLAFRSSCRAAICGSCAMHINGKYCLACNTAIEKLKSPTVIIKPLSHLPVLKDLVVDQALFFENWRLVEPYLIPKDTPPTKEYLQSTEQRKKLNVLSDCIMCGACYGSCPVASGDNHYLGPHSFLKALRFINDSRDGAKKERLKVIGSEYGVWRCHTVFNCQQVCPKNLDPAGAIANLKLKFTLSKFKREI